MEHSSHRWVRFLAALILCALAPSVAHAQRIPEEAVWLVVASLFAPFVAVPLKMIALRFAGLDAPTSRLWIISALEWILWFPVAVVLLRSQGYYTLPIAVVILFAGATWLHQTRLTDTSWKSALLLSFITPALLVALPILTFAIAAFFQSVTY